MAYQGTVKSFNAAKGWGFIECPETKEVYMKDIFLMKSALPNGVASKGQQVTFDVVEGDNGVQAANVAFLGEAPAFEAPQQSPRQQQGGRGDWGGSAGGQGQFSGVVKSYNATKGWGFIECPETHGIYGKDMFLLKSKLPQGMDQINSGEQVTFNVAETGTGPQCVDVQLLQQQGRRGARPSGPPPAPRGNRAMSQPIVPAPPAPVEEDADHIGTVKSVNEAKGYGFLTSPTLLAIYGKDIFFQTRELPGPANVGDKLAFAVAQGQKGPTAINIQLFRSGPGPIRGGGMAAPMPGPYPVSYPAAPSFPIVEWTPARPSSRTPPAPPPARGGGGGGHGGGRGGGKGGHDGRYEGVIKSINMEKGWGHITCQAAQEMYGKDVFLRRSELENKELEAGMAVTFGISMGSKGPQAEDVQAGSTGGGGGAKGNTGAAGDGTVYYGQVKTYNAKKGWGFATGDDIVTIFGKDIFLHKRELNGVVPSAGDDVQFTVTVGAKGGLEARDVVFSSLSEDYEASRQSGKKQRSSPY